MRAYFDRFSIDMTKREAKETSHQGQCDDDVEYLVNTPKMTRQLNKLNPVLIRAELKEYGAWDETELNDDAQNIRRIVWLAAGNINEYC